MAAAQVQHGANRFRAPAQTPQVFRRALILACFEKIMLEAPEKEMTDDAAICEFFQHRVALVDSSASNFKVTQPEDLAIAEAFLSGGLVAGSYVVFEVRDNGMGMNAQTKAKIFDPFFTTKFTGRGLGLSAVQGILRAHKGALQLETAIGRGSTFRVFLPACSKALPSTPDAYPANTQRPGTILVIDDDEFVRKVSKASLEREGFKVLLAGSGEEGMDALLQKRSLPLSLVVLDMSMPILSGREVLEDLRLRLRPRMTSFNEI